MRPIPIAAAAALAAALLPLAGAEAKRRTDCERPRTVTLLETSQVRVYEVRRGSAIQGNRTTASYACRKGSTRKPLLLFDDADGPGAAADFDVLGTKLAMTVIGCDPTGFGCGSEVRLLDLRTRRSLRAQAEPAGTRDVDWEAVRALQTSSGALVFASQSPVNAGGAARPAVDGRIAVLGPDGVVRELDRGAGVEADTLAVARRSGRPTLVTWRSAGGLRSAEL